MTLDGKVHYLKTLARKYYNQGGDRMIECWDTNDLEEWILEEKLTTREEIKARALELFAVWHSYAEDIRGTAF